MLILKSNDIHCLSRQPRLSHQLSMQKMPIKKVFAFDLVKRNLDHHLFDNLNILNTLLQSLEINFDF